MKAAGRGAATAFLPTPEQELLLQACVLAPEPALAAWRTWQGTVDIDRADQGSVRLLPLLAERLTRLGVSDPRFGAYRGVQRRTWARNVLLFRGAAEVIGRLAAAGVASLALKGLVLAKTCYDAPSLRPMGDFDLLIRQGDAEAAFEVLEGAGWRLQAPSMRPRTPADFAAHNSVVYEDAAKPEVSVDLHWRLFWGRHSPQADAALWAAATSFSVEGAGCLAPSPADMLLHICAHGARWNDLPPQRWVADAVMQLRAQSIDWDHFVRQAGLLGLGPPLTDALGYLREVMGAPIPQAVLEGLAGLKTRPIDRLVYAAELRPSRRRGLLATTRLHLHIAQTHLGERDGVGGYWSYLQAVRAGRGLRALTAWAGGRLFAGLRR